MGHFFQRLVCLGNSRVLVTARRGPRLRRAFLSTGEVWLVCAHRKRVSQADEKQKFGHETLESAGP